MKVFQGDLTLKMNHSLSQISCCSESGWWCGSAAGLGAGPAKAPDRCKPPYSQSLSVSQACPPCLQTTLRPVGNTLACPLLPPVGQTESAMLYCRPGLQAEWRQWSSGAARMRWTWWWPGDCLYLAMTGSFACYSCTLYLWDTLFCFFLLFLSVPIFFQLVFLTR